ncbi:MAG: LysM peptidoglycan-binding domain-containing M23 family metallopeptidase [Candidatus Omnitrophota bacterium]
MREHIFNNRKKITYLLTTIFYLLFFAGCASAPYIKPAAPVAGIPGVYHRVEKGQTLWKISKLYNVDLDRITQINHISDTSNIEIGQLIFIPNRQKQVSLPDRYASEDFMWPVKGRVIAAFGQVFNNMVNKGINIQPYDNLEVVASRAGKVVFYKDNFRHFGKTLIIDHGDGFSTVYARNAQVFVKAGDSVGKGSVIAKTGCGGRSKSTYLHFEIRKGYAPQNPIFYLP